MTALLNQTSSSLLAQPKPAPLPPSTDGWPYIQYRQAISGHEWNSPMWKALLLNLLGFWLALLLFIGLNLFSYYLYSPCTTLVPCDAPQRVGFPFVFMAPFLAQ